MSDGLPMNGSLRARNTGQDSRSETLLPTRSVEANGDDKLSHASAGKHVSEYKRQWAKSKNELPAAVALTVLPEWLNLLAMVSLIFGGCCSNVFTLEAIVKEAPGSGTLITCFQFLLTMLFTLPSHLDFSRGIRYLYLKPRAIPFMTWIKYTALFVTINLLNNKAFHYKISVPLHIILRSAGPVATMTVQRLMGRHFESRKIAAVFLLFAGVVLAAIADAQAKTADLQLSSIPSRSSSEFWTGFGLLYLALMLSAVMGVYTDRTYAKYGRDHTEENLFYSHTLSLPFILLRWSELRDQGQTLMLSPSSTILISSPHTGSMPMMLKAIDRVPVHVVFLFMNGLTQYFCIRGVNLLSARSSSLTVSIVLNIRKLLSLLLSIWLFGNQLAPGVLVGAALVFMGVGLYAIPRSDPKSKERKDKTEKEV